MSGSDSTKASYHWPSSSRFTAPSLSPQSRQTFTFAKPIKSTTPPRIALAFEPPPDRRRATVEEGGIDEAIPLPPIDELPYSLGGQARMEDSMGRTDEIVTMLIEEEAASECPVHSDIHVDNE